MTYLKIKPQYDNYRRKDGNILVANELYTQKEFKKYGIKSEMAEPVEVSKKKIMFMFGARFEVASR